jgi:hypothetical protein
MLDGSPTYCCYGGPASEAGAIPVLHTLWFVAIPVLAFLGMVAAARLGRLPEIMVAAAPAGLLATFYVFFLTFAGLRFLLPIVALLSLPVATGLVEVVTRTAPRRRAVAAGVVAVLVTGHVGLMIGTATIRLPILADRRDRDVRIAEAVRPLMTSRPCVVIGEQPQVRSYYLGCRVQGLRGTAQPPARVTSALQEGGSVIAVLSKPPPRRSYLSSWRAVPLPQVGPRWVAYLPPGSGIGG